MRTFITLGLLLGMGRLASAREVEPTGSLERAQVRVERAPSKEKESTVSTKYESSFPVRDLTRATKPGSI